MAEDEGATALFVEGAVTVEEAAASEGAEMLGPAADQEMDPLPLLLFSLLPLLLYSFLALLRMNLKSSCWLYKI